MAGLRLAMAFLLIPSVIGVVICGVDVLRTEESPKFRAIMVLAGSGTYWELVAKGASRSAEKNGVVLEFLTPATAAEQLALLSRLAKAPPDAVAVCPLSHEVCQAYVERLAKKTKLLTFANDLPQTEQLLHLGVSAPSVCDGCAEAVVAAMPEGGRVIVLSRRDSSYGGGDRCDYLQAALNRQNGASPSTDIQWQTTYLYSDDPLDEVTLANAIGDSLAGHPGSACVVDLGGLPLDPLRRSLKFAQADRNLPLILGDAKPDGLASVASGLAFAAVSPEPVEMGRCTAEWIALLCSSSRLGLPVAGRGRASIPAQTFTQAKIRELGLTGRL